MSEPAPNECPDCGNYFPLRTENGTCQKCQKLAAFKRGTADYEEHESRAQCEMCGLTRRNNMPLVLEKQTCGTARCVDENSTVPETYRERAVRTMSRFKITAAKPGTEMHTAALLHHEQGLGNATEEHIKLAIGQSESAAKCRQVPPWRQLAAVWAATNGGTLTHKVTLWRQFAFLGGGNVADMKLFWAAVGATGGSVGGRVGRQCGRHSSLRAAVRAAVSSVTWRQCDVGGGNFCGLAATWRQLWQ
ncbi:hypothetical protein B0H11DRAFT_1901468 [Mycena galericulata]|nr:hypothetical protein B0H11DRAFT_1901468 [Mycena galericulata]